MTAAQLKSLADLVAAGLLPAPEAERLKPVTQRYAVAISSHLQARIANIRPGDGDALARQFVPNGDELINSTSDLADPIGDERHSPVKGIVHRYSDRVLLKITSVCPVYCRFCFRREMIGPGTQGVLTAAEFATALDYIKGRSAIREVIFTGGDPLILSPRRISDVTRAVSAIPHVEKLRWHSRVPVVCPDRVIPALTSALTSTRKVVHIAIHANHPQEFSPAARVACRRLAAAGIKLLSQSVLLRGLNDTPETLIDLCHAFENTAIQSYYMHHLDKAPGTSHFHVPLRNGMALIDALHHRLPKSAVPQYTLDIPGGFGKVPVTKDHVRLVARDKKGDLYRIRDPFGSVHIYRDRP